MSKERLINYIIFVITDTMIDAWEQHLCQLHDNLMLLRKEPTNLLYIYEWVKGNQQYVINAGATINNIELHKLVIDGMRLAYAHYYNSDKLYDTNESTSVYAKKCQEEYKAAIAERK